MRAKKPVIFTIGHSTHGIEEFIEILQAHGVEEVVDVRTIPKSRHNPQFAEDALRESLRAAKIRYKHEKRLGGLRHTTKDSVNTGWRNTSFRGYADYMATADFENGIEALEKIAKMRATAIMCAEALPWRCHRSLIADALTKRGWRVLNIMSRTNAPVHKPTPFLKMRRGVLTYPAA